MTDVTPTRSTGSDPMGDPLCDAVEEIGDRWMILIIGAAFGGTSRFDDFQRELNVARNILSNRLRRLVDLEILQKRPVREGARRMQYALTDKGHALRETLQDMRDWGDAWAAARRGEGEGEAAD
jgi:DNA-binding HxlR family transcriptional regulator